jgi:hypothetical protein
MENMTNRECPFLHSEAGPLNKCKQNDCAFWIEKPLPIQKAGSVDTATEIGCLIILNLIKSLMFLY